MSDNNQEKPKSIDLFGHEKYENLDWLTKAIEPFEYSGNAILASLPDEVHVDFAMLQAITQECGHGAFERLTRSFNARTIVNHMLRQQQGNSIDLNLLATETVDEIIACFEFAPLENTIVDFRNKTLIGSPIILTKKVNVIPDEKLSKLLGTLGGRLLHRLHFDYHSIQEEKMDEVLELLGEANFKRKSLNSKIDILIRKHDQIMNSNSWKIKNVDLSNRVATWIFNYITDGKLADFNTLCRLKIMTHSGYPIYSIEETV